jgi:hypothetical protein
LATQRFGSQQKGRPCRLLISEPKVVGHWRGAAGKCCTASSHCAGDDKGPHLIAPWNMASDSDRMRDHGVGDFADTELMAALVV